MIGDGVSYAPHGFPDVKELDVDFYTFSLYKTYGPHLALLYGKENILKKVWWSKKVQMIFNVWPLSIFFFLERKKCYFLV